MYFNVLDISKPRVIPDRSDYTGIIIITLQFKFQALEANGHFPPQLITVINNCVLFLMHTRHFYIVLDGPFCHSGQEMGHVLHGLQFIKMGNRSYVTCASR